MLIFSAFYDWIVVLEIEVTNIFLSFETLRWCYFCATLFSLLSLTEYIYIYMNVYVYVYVYVWNSSRSGLT